MARGAVVYKLARDGTRTPLVGTEPAPRDPACSINFPVAPTDPALSGAMSHAAHASGRLPDRLLILSVFVVASCGLAYELIAGALSSYLLGDSVLQFSSIIGCYLFAMGVGSHLSKYVDDRDVLARFIDIELLVGLLGGLSATLLFLLFAWMSAPSCTMLLY